MGGKSGGTTTSNSSSTVPQSVLDEYNQVTAQANQVASAPLNQYGGQIVAGLTPDETAAMGTVKNAQGIAAPYTQQASGLISQSTQNIDPRTVTSADIQNYQSPYTQQVLNSTMAAENNQDAQQQAQLQGNAISSGAWGGDRAGVAQGILGGQQAFANNATNAGILNQGYTQALQEANTQQQAGIGAQEASQQLQANGGLAANQIGTSALANTLTGANAQLQSGELQQQQAQSDLNVPYEEFLQSQAYPFQTTGWLGNIAEGIGSNEGGSSTSSTTQPSEGLFGLKRGGGISGPKHYKIGGIVPSHMAAGGQPTASATPPVYKPIIYASQAGQPGYGQTAYENELKQYNASAPVAAAVAAPSGFSAQRAPTYAQFAAGSPANSGTPYTGGIAAGVNTANQSDLDAIYGGKFSHGGAPKHFNTGGGGDDDDYYENDTLGNAGTGYGDIDEAAARLSAQRAVESENNPDAVSPAGAKGIMQVMDGTNSDPGFGVRPAQDDSPEERARVGEDYSNAMIQRYRDKNLGIYNGHDLGLMAYNWGPGNVDKLLNGEIGPSQIPDEAANYPGKVTSAMGAVDPAAYSTNTATNPEGLPPPTPPVNAADHPSNSGYTAEMPTAHEANPWLSVAAGVLGTLAGRSRNPLVDIGQGGLIGINNYAAQQKQADEENFTEGSFKNNVQKMMDATDLAKKQFAEEKLKDADQQQNQESDIKIKQQLANQGKIGTNQWGQPYYTSGPNAGQVIPQTQPNGVSTRPPGAPDFDGIKKIAENIGIQPNFLNPKNRADTQKTSAMIFDSGNNVAAANDGIISLQRIKDLLPQIDQGKLAQAERYGEKVLGVGTPERAAYEEIQKLEGNAALQNEINNGVKGRNLGFNMAKLGQGFFANPEMSKDAQNSILDKAILLSKTAKNANEIIPMLEGSSLGTLVQAKQKYYNDSIAQGAAIPTQDYVSGNYKKQGYVNPSKIPAPSQQTSQGQGSGSRPPLSSFMSQ